ncbi:hypothetical protein ACH46N_04940 [Streptomyces pristinaespiralis]|uniref:Uncharacterized protein n=2 Tax=Streptomyces pristinaespiralis TaxID=38300 RepID=B5HHM0_STRE2|nr:hypothetical protein [Streptomyces pristinaespiralis]ALC19075.1 hypothetical protein SPRI_0769 [Streptomyces pristinaespiralis]EDY66346.1 conserved hypothetical protein [Streptomyces pristinaespiralis ATCC 25486]QMU17834.1 hypothetical protein H3L99_33105 [Streptomyces pristinaespiralis]
MQPESTNGTSGGGLAVPMAWLCAEYTADEMLRTGALVEADSLEFRAGRQTLALTIHLCDGGEPLSGGSTAARIDHWLTVTSYGYPWPRWVREQLGVRAERVRHGGKDPDLALAADAWRRLCDTELLATDLGGLEPWHPSRPPGASPDEADRVWLPAWELGLPLGHLAVHLW